MLWLVLLTKRSAEATPASGYPHVAPRSGHSAVRRTAAQGSMLKRIQLSTGSNGLDALEHSAAPRGYPRTP